MVDRVLRWLRGDRDGKVSRVDETPDNWIDQYPPTSGSSDTGEESPIRRIVDDLADLPRNATGWKGRQARRKRQSEQGS